MRHARSHARADIAFVDQHPYIQYMTAPVISSEDNAHVDEPIFKAIASITADAGELVLAVSGGSDSMVLLHAMSRWAPQRVAVVATYDHGTGPHATNAAALVVHEARRLGFNVVRERSRSVGATEAAWRDARWAFLNRVAGAYRARVATAHSANDQLETVVQRLLRGTGARGLAALAAPGLVVRPWLSLSRAQLVRYREYHAVPFVADPSNHDRRHQRVRVREDLLPAISRVDPRFAADMLGIAERAASWRREVDEFVRTLPWRAVSAGVWQLDRAAVEGWRPEQLAVVWPALLGPCGIMLDGGGTRRLIRFTIGSGRAGQLSLPGGAAVVRRGHLFEVRAADVVSQRAAAWATASMSAAVGTTVRWGEWRFVPCSAALVADPPLTMAGFPGSGVLEVRAWRAGDRIRNAAAGAGRRISRYLAEYEVPRLDRGGWPVVLLDGEVVWVPEIVRGLSAPSRSGRSDLIWYRSEREFG